MGIQTTIHIKRDEAIRRIHEIMMLVCDYDYRGIEQTTCECDYDVMDFVKNYEDMEASNIDKWTNKMLEDVIDKPFYRYSMFDNYWVHDNEEDI